MDGLLIDSERSIMKAWQSAAAASGLALSDAAYVSVIGRAAAESDARLAELLGGVAVFQRLREEVLSTLGTFPPKPGAAKLLARLSEYRVPCAVATSTAIEEARQRLELAGLIDFFRAMAGGDEVAKGKPDPSVYLLAAQRLGVTPTQCLAFEDSPNGTHAALAAGMHVVVVPDLVAPVEVAGVCHLNSLVDALDHADRWFSRRKDAPGSAARHVACEPLS